MASKKRFINKYFDKFTQYWINDKEDFLKFVDTALDSILIRENQTINWQKLSDDDIRHIVSCYEDYIYYGGSLKSRKLKKKDDPNKIFIDNRKGLKAVYEGEDFSNADFLILKSLENEDYIFVVPLTHKACIFIDSSYCGGVGAKWCIGHKVNKKFFKGYIKIQESGISNHLYVMAFNKNVYKNLSRKNEDNLKYMIDIETDEEEGIVISISYWTQTDLRKRDNIFSIDYTNLYETFFKIIINSGFESIYTNGKNFNNHIIVDYNQPNNNTLSIVYNAVLKNKINGINKFITDQSEFNGVLLKSVSIENNDLCIEYHDYIHNIDFYKKKYFKHTEIDGLHKEDLVHTNLHLIKKFLLFHYGIELKIIDHKNFIFMPLKNNNIQVRCNLSNIEFNQCEEITLNNEEKFQKMYLRNKNVLIVASNAIEIKEIFKDVLQKYSMFLIRVRADTSLSFKDGYYYIAEYRNILKRFN